MEKPGGEGININLFVKIYYIFHIFREIGSIEGGGICIYLTWAIFNGGSGVRTSEARVEVGDSRTLQVKNVQWEINCQKEKMIKTCFFLNRFSLSL